MNSHPVVFLEGVEDRTAAEELVKAILWAESDPAEQIEEDAWYDHQLVGLDVVRDGAVVGRVSRVDHLPAQDLLVVVQDGQEVLVPFVKAIVPEVDVAARRVVVTPPAGLFEDLPADADDEPADAGGAEPTAGDEAGDGDTASGTGTDIG